MPNLTIEDLRNELKLILPKLAAGFVDQAEAVIETLTTTTQEASESALICVTQMGRISALVATGKMTEESGRLAIQNYLDSLALIAKTLDNVTAIESCERAKKMLEALGNIGLTIISIALKAGMGEASNVLLQLKDIKM